MKDGRDTSLFRYADILLFTHPLDTEELLTPCTVQETVLAVELKRDIEKEYALAVDGLDRDAANTYGYKLATRTRVVYGLAGDVRRWFFVKVTPLPSTASTGPSRRIE